MSLTPRETARRNTLKRIRTIGFRQLDEGGPEALNLRAIARELGIVASGMYRYVPDRNALVTLLIVDAYEDLARAVRESDDVHAGPRTRLHTLVATMRGWALDHPRRWALIYGTPLPEYQAPPEQTLAPGTAVAVLFLHLAAQSDLQPSTLDDPPAPLKSEFAAIADEQGVDISPAILERAIEAWISVLGLINAEAFGYLGTEPFSDFDAVAKRIVDRIGDSLGLS